MAWFTAKEWKNRLVEFAGRRSLKNVSTNETTVYDVTRNEGQVSQEGDSFSATTMNDLEQRISDAFAEAEEANTQLSSDLGGLSFGQDEEGNWGYIPSGADAVIPFSPPVVTLKGSMAYNLSISGGNQDSASTRIFAPEDMEIESIQYTTSGRFYGSNYMRIYDGSNNMIANRTSAGGTTITEITDRSSVAIGLYRGGQNIGGAEGNFGCSYTITFRKKNHHKTILSFTI